MDDKIYIDQSSNPFIEGKKTFLKVDTLVFGVICVSGLSILTTHQFPAMMGLTN